MFGISCIGVTATYLSRGRPEIEAGRAIQRQAMAEYEEKHGGHHH